MGRTTKARQYKEAVEYQDIVRTTPMQEPTKPSTVVVRTKPTTASTMRSTTTATTSSERSQPIYPVSTTELFSAAEPSTSTLRSSTKPSERSRVTKSSTGQVPPSSSSSPDLTESTPAVSPATTEFSSTISQSTLATTSVTPSDGSTGSSVKQSSEDDAGVDDQLQSEITTRNPVELPSRPREELKQDLLEAIRRKISRSKVSSSSSSSSSSIIGQKGETGFEISSQ